MSTQTASLSNSWRKFELISKIHVPISSMCRGRKKRVKWEPELKNKPDTVTLRGCVIFCAFKFAHIMQGEIAQLRATHTIHTRIYTMQPVCAALQTHGRVLPQNDQCYQAKIWKRIHKSFGKYTLEHIRHHHIQ